MLNREELDYTCRPLNHIPMGSVQNYWKFTYLISKHLRTSWEEKSCPQISTQDFGPEQRWDLFLDKLFLCLSQNKNIPGLGVPGYVSSIHI